MARGQWSALASAENVAQIRDAVLEFIQAIGIADARANDIRLAVSEAVANAVMHAYRCQAQPGSVHVSATADGEWIELQVIDEGIGSAPRTDSPGLGVGLSLIRRLADQTELRLPPGGHGTEVWMRFRVDE
jgi:anti-sigma regulatory factor (Ser/Thr protein kinase)